MLAVLLLPPHEREITHRLMSASGQPGLSRFLELLPHVEPAMRASWDRTFAAGTWPDVAPLVVARALRHAADQLRHDEHPDDAVARSFARALATRADHPFYEDVAERLLDL